MKLDTGAATNVMPLKVFNKITRRPTLKSSDIMLKAYGGHQVNHMGKCEMKISAKDQEEEAEFYVVDTKSPPILGVKSCEKLGLVIRGVDSIQKGSELTKESLAEEFKDVCQGLGCFKVPYNIELKVDADPVKEPPRRVPFALQDRLKLKLDSMEQQGVIVKMDRPTDWVHNLVIVEKKDGGLRICLDPRNLNQAIKREHFQIPTLEDITGCLGGKKRKHSGKFPSLRRVLL